jgi:hypothetical protein
MRDQMVLMLMQGSSSRPIDQRRIARHEELHAAAVGCGRSHDRVARHDAGEWCRAPRFTRLRSSRGLRHQQLVIVGAATAAASPALGDCRGARSTASVE